MKYITSAIGILFFLQVYAQKTESYYDYNWKPCEPLKARFYSTLEKTDSGWLRYDYFLSGMKLQMKALFADSACEIFDGQSIFVHANGNISSVGRQIRNKQEGICLGYYPNGMMSDSASYQNGRPVGNKLRWWPNGVIQDSTVHVNDSLDIAISWFDNGQPSQAGYLLHGQLHGSWKFFHNNGKIAAIEVYDRGKIVSKQYFKEDGNLKGDTLKGQSDASFWGGPVGWQTYLSNKLSWPTGYEFTTGDMAVVVVEITIGEDGKPETVEVVTPFHPSLDAIALSVVKKSPAWNPRIVHNRRVKATFRQPVVFRQEEN